MFTIYTKPECIYCQKAKDLFKYKGVTYKELVVEKDISSEEYRDIIPGFTTVPGIRAYLLEAIMSYRVFYQTKDEGWQSRDFESKDEAAEFTYTSQFIDYYIEDEFHYEEPDISDAEALASAGFGTDEDYGYFGE